MNASLELQNGIKVLGQTPLDKKYYNADNVPYSSVAEVMAQLPLSLRSQGLRVNVAGVEYWWPTSNLNIEPVLYGNTFALSPLTTVAELDANLTSSVRTVALSAVYLDWNTPYFSLLTMPYSHGVYHHMQVAYVFSTATDDSFSIKARWISNAPNSAPTWTAWKTLTGGLEQVAKILRDVPHDILAEELTPSHELYVIGKEELPPGSPGIAITTGWRVTLANFSNYLFQRLAALFNLMYAAVNHNHNLANLGEKSYNSLTDKPTIPAAQVQSDWNATEGLGAILNKPTIPAPGITQETDPIYTADKPHIQRRLHTEITIQWLTNAIFPQGPIGSQPGDYWIRNIYDNLKRKNGFTNEFENVDWDNGAIYIIGNARYLHNGSYLVKISENSTYTPPPAAETITLAASESYTIVAGTPANLLVRATGAGASIAYGALSANKAITIAIAGDSQPVTVGGTAYSGGVTLFVAYTHSNTSWSINTILDPQVPDMSDIAVKAALPAAVTPEHDGGDLYSVFGVYPHVVGDILLHNPTTQANTAVYQVLLNAGDFLNLRRIATATQLRIVRIAGGNVLYNEYDGLNASSIKFVKYVSNNSTKLPKLGFQTLDATLSIVHSTRVFTITGAHTYYVNDVEVVKGTTSTTLANVTGIHYVFYNSSNVLTSNTTGFEGTQVAIVVRSTVSVITDQRIPVGYRPSNYNGDFAEEFITTTGTQTITLKKSTVTAIGKTPASGTAYTPLDNTNILTIALPQPTAGFNQSVLYFETGDTIPTINQPANTVVFGSFILSSLTRFKLVYDRIHIGAGVYRTTLNFDKI